MSRSRSPSPSRSRCHWRRLAALVGIAGAVVLTTGASAAFAQGRDTAAAHSRREGRPKVELDRLHVEGSPLAASREAVLRKILAREARRVDWGAGRHARITYRFRVDELEAKVESGVLRVRCSATGWLPKGKVAKSRITFGGAEAERDVLVDRVLEVVARGVLTRLAELERKRREQ